MYKYHRLVKFFSRLFSIVASLGDIFAFLAPILWTWWFDPRDFIENMLGGTLSWAHFWAFAYLVYLLVRIILKYYIIRDERNPYRKQFLEQIDSISRDKYKSICYEIHSKIRQNNDILFYDAHGVIRNILTHIRQLVANITDVSLSNISVNFVYKYHGSGEHWQTIDGSSSCSIGTLDEIVEKGSSMYHYLYANNCEYIFYNDKAAVDWHRYMPSLRDGDDKKSWGSIYCKRILCTLHQDRIVDGILAVSTYNEKFSSSRMKAVVTQIEGLLNEAISAFENIIKAEMVSLYLRHSIIKRNREEAIEYLIKLGIINKENKNKKDDKDIEYIAKLSEDERKKELEEAIPKFKKKFDKCCSICFAEDVSFDQKIADILRYRKTHPNEKQEGSVAEERGESKEDCGDIHNG